MHEFVYRNILGMSQRFVIWSGETVKFLPVVIPRSSALSDVSEFELRCIQYKRYLILGLF